jgi:O-succinylbenzoate synthase
VQVSSDGFINVPQTPGRGFQLKTDLIEKLTVRKQTLRAGASSAAD